MSLLTFLRKKHASLHWYFQRATAVLLLPTMLWILFSAATFASSAADASAVITHVVQQNPSLLLLVNILLFWHIRVGLESIVEDYVHHEVTKFFSFFTIRVLTILLIKYFYVLTFSLA